MNNLNSKIIKRSTQEKLLLSLSAVCVIGILPFTVLRAIQHDWVMLVLDSLVVIGMFFVFLYVYKTNDIKYSSIGIVFIAQAGSLVSFYINGGIIISWIYPAMLTIFFVVKPKTALLLNFVLICAYFPKLSSVFSLSDIVIILISLLIALMIAYSFAQGLRRQEIILKKIASEDYLTKTGNRRSLHKKLKDMHQLLKNHDNTASLILIDLDHFKEVNDKHGHLVGDKVLVDLTSLLQKNINKHAKIFRYGGEEFIVTYYDTSIKKAYEFAENFRKVIKKNIIVKGKQVTISLGVAEYHKDESIDEWIHRVDLALYQAKNQGRDRTIKAN